MAQIDTQQHDIERREGAWVVGIDGSDAAAHALDWAAGHAPGRATRLQLVTSWQAPVTGPAGDWNGAGGQAFDRGPLVAGAQCVVDEATARVSALDGVSIEPVIAHGGPSAVLLDAADGADLLVIGSRGRGGFKRLLLGSTSTQCTTHASGPVAVVPTTASVQPATDIVVGIDGSNNSIAALVWALAFAAPGSRVEALSVWDTSPIAVGADQFFFPEASDLAETRFHHLIDRVLTGQSRTNSDGVHVERRFITGTPRRELGHRSTSTDLLVLGARGHGALGAALMGSVSTWSLHHSNIATVIVPARSG